MKITTVHLSFLFSTGGYQNEKIGLTAELQEGETVDDAVTALREKVYENANRGQEVQELYKARQDLRNVRYEIQRAQHDYEQVKEFMEAQGLKKDMPNFPILQQIAPPPAESERLFVEEDDPYRED